MAIPKVWKSYVFPRIPLKFELPESYPGAGKISSVTVVPKIRNFRFERDELEIKGSYQVTVSYFKAFPEPIPYPVEQAELQYDGFFSHLKLQSDGFFADREEDYPAGPVNPAAELYTVQFLRPLHTFIDLEFVGRTRNYRPGLVVEKVEVEGGEGRLLKGELVLGLVNRGRRTY